jgi:Tat protein translocase TatB subunit
MFDITSSKLLILGVVALIVIGPKDLPILLRTIGKYLGMMRRQANEFRAQFDEAMRETELEQIKKDVENLGREAEASMRDAEHAIKTDLHVANADVENSIRAAGDAARIEPPVPHDALNGLLAEPAINVEPAHLESAHVEPAHAESAKAEPAHIESAHVSPSHAKTTTETFAPPFNHTGVSVPADGQTAPAKLEPKPPHRTRVDLAPAKTGT